MGPLVKFFPTDVHPWGGTGPPWEGGVAIEPAGGAKTHPRRGRAGHRAAGGWRCRQMAGW